MANFSLETPVRVSRAGHYLDGAPVDLVQQLSYRSAVQGYANDFLRWEGPLAASTGTGGWVCSATGTAAIVVKDSATNGVLRIATSAADNDATLLQLKGSGFKYRIGDKMWFEIRLAPGDADDGEIFFGLGLEGTTAVPGTLPTDGFMFEKAEAGTKMDFHARKNAVSTERTLIDTAAMADDTFHTYAFYINAAGDIAIYYDDVLQHTMLHTDTNIVDDEDLSLYIGVQTGAGDVDYVDVDHVLVAVERNS